ncbi:hypothetical protein E1298_04825 [Actinomadura rubrisoli]|uniref:DUF4333 domain-containing protein n=1 Tax=Actinomadura rubrisoli TaxID=2530368 RepID=A0A4R5CE72_9ACTN|nr:hypothetical protein E1298_04825 [Actinomadura rubrisoli]
MSRKRTLILGSAASVLVLAVVGAGIAYLMLSGGDDLRYKSQSALLKALPANAAAELRTRGVTLQSPLKCKDLPGWTKKKLRASCTGTTTDRRDVQVLGSGEERTSKSYYTILVGGHPIVENAPCLGADCRGKDG